MIRFFVWMPFGVGLVTYFIFVRRLRLSRRGEFLWAGVLLLAAAKFLGFSVLGGHAFSPDLPEVVIWVWDVLYSGMMLLFALSIVFCFRFRFKGWLLPLIAWGLAVWGLWEGLRVPAIREVTLEFPALPPKLKGYRIVQLSDLHCSFAARRWRTQAVVDAVLALKPDLICLTGDYADGRVQKIGTFLEPLKALRARDGVLACTGNHEYYHDYSDWWNYFYSQVDNVRFLTNECVFPHTGLAVAGVPDVTGWRKDRIDALPDVRQAFASATNGEFRVLLQHGPKFAAENLAELGVDLQLSGHTHGGIAPCFRWLVAHHNGGFVRGLYRLGKGVLYVSSGSGQWPGFPMRIFNPSEITLLILR